MPGNDSYTKLLLHMDGSDQSQVFTDSSLSVHSVTVQGTPKIVTDQSKFGGASASLPGTTSDYLTLDDSVDWTFGAGDWTIDFWFRLFSTPDTIGYFIWRQVADANNYFRIFPYYDGATYRIDAQDIEAGAIVFSQWTSGNLTLNINQWYHLAVVRYGFNTDLKIALDGTFLAVSSSYSISGKTLGNLAGPASIGYRFAGWLDEFRLSKDIARWTSNFTPPTSAYSPYTLRSIGDVIALTESKSKKPISKSSFSLTLSESKSLRPRLITSPNSFTLSDASLRKAKLIKQEQFTNLDSTVKKFVTPRADTTTLSEARYNKFKTPRSDQFTLSMGILIRPRLLKSEILQILDQNFSYFNDALTLGISDGLFLSESLSRYGEFHRISSDALSLVDARVRKFDILKTDTLSPIDSILKRIAFPKQDGLSLSENLVSKASLKRAYSELITLSDTFSRLLVYLRIFSNNISLSDAYIEGLRKAPFIRRAIVMHLFNHAFSTYENYNFNSLAHFNGVFWGANENGIYILGAGDDDLGTPIDAEINGGLLDLSEREVKLPVEGWFAGRSDGDMVLTVRPDEATSPYEYTFKKVGNNHEIRASIGKGIKGRFFSFGIKNLLGKNFDLESLRILGKILPRKTR